MAQDETTAAAAEEPVADSAPSDPPVEDDAGAAAEGATKPSKKRKAKAPRETKATKKPAGPRKQPAHPPYADVRLRWNPFSDLYR
ncbi:hypothetical protein BHM03_00012773 [Ensete ventricosum]|nr:hypothetical protein BHM03_00012773 [Ensete ventricosum]